MPYFEETPVTIAYPTFIVTTCTEHNRSRKCPFLRKEIWQVTFLFSWKQHILHILGLENTTFWGDLCYYSLLNPVYYLYLYLYYLFWTYYVSKMPLFEESPVTTAYPIIIVTTCTEYTRSRKRQFLRRDYLTSTSSIIIVTTYFAHIRSRKCHFLRREYWTSKFLSSWFQHTLHI